MFKTFLIHEKYTRGRSMKMNVFFLLQPNDFVQSDNNFSLISFTQNSKDIQQQKLKIYHGARCTVFYNRMNKPTQLIVAKNFR